MKVLITGGTGSLGKHLVRSLVGRADVVVFSRDPHKQVAMKRTFPAVKFRLGCVTDYDAVSRAMDGVDVLIHAAAVKYVSIGEDRNNFNEVIKVNSIGSSVVARAWDNRGMAVVVSSDKAVSPVNLYGATKMQAEYEFVMRGYSAVRYGNVVSSNGSFIHSWLENRDSVCVREPFPTRFYMPMSSAVSLVLDTIRYSEKGVSGVFVPIDLKSFSLFDMAKLLTDSPSLGSLEHGEKVHESLVSDGDGVRALSDSVGIVVRGSNSDVSMYSSKNCIVDARTILRSIREELKK